jgi:hypothetical protein
MGSWSLVPSNKLLLLLYITTIKFRYCKMYYMEIENRAVESILRKNA